MRKSLKIILILFILFFGIYSLIFEPNYLKIEKKTLVIEKLPSSFEGIKIVQLSDLHSLWFGPREKKLLEILEKINPSFIFITGDFVDPITKAITDRKLNSTKKFWQKLEKKYKDRLFVVLGNHDTKLVKKTLKESEIKVLDNENIKLYIGNDFIYLIGVNDPRTKQANLPKAMKGIENEVPKILLAHAPEIVKEEKIKEMDLILVGDTHGGQVTIPILGRIIQPLSKYGKKYTKGLFQINSTYLYVNRGVGTSVFPIRFACPPEITIIELLK